VNDSQFLAYCQAKFVEGQRELAGAMRTLVAHEDQDIHDALAEAGDAAFLEPLFFTYFFAKPPRMELAQLAFGHVPLAARPGAFPVQTDACGRAYLPQIGHLLTASPALSLTAHWDASDGIVALEDEAGRRVPHSLSPCAFIPDTTLELLSEGNPLLDVTFVDVDGARVDGAVPSSGAPHGPAMARALTLIDEVEPAYSELLLRATRQVFVFRYPRVNNFATLNAHGVVCFNAGDHDDEVFFVDELVHQCGHVIFNAISVRRRELFVADPDAPIAGGFDQRSLYTVLHGLYTERAMVRCLRRLDEGAVLTGRQAHELRGRLAFIVRKMQLDIGSTNCSGLFTPLGETLVEAFRATFEDAVRERPDLLRDDLHGQPYNFDYAVYARHNPPAKWSVAAE